MKKMLSEITTAAATNRLKQLDRLVETGRRQQVYQAAPTISAQGVPGEYDHRKFLTPVFEGFIPIQNAVGSSVVNTIAVRTNPAEGWKSSLPQFVNTLFGAERKPEDTRDWYTDISAEGVTTTTTVDGTPPSRAVVSGRTTPNDFSIRLVQETDKR